MSRLTAALSERYRIVRQIGAGGMATVYLAHDLKHGRQVAIKVMRPEVSALVGADRFLKEIAVTANLQHPHILSLHDSGGADGLLYYVSPFVSGGSLRDRLDREGELPIEETISIATRVASALDYAHRHDVIHRDIKPENILFQDGQPIVGDFGVALAVTAAGGPRLTETGLSVGTPFYMSPEQAAGDQILDERCDIYALGCVCYEMLAGEPPFTGRTPQAILARKLSETAPDAVRVRETVPVATSAVIRKALARLPADRFRSAREFGKALETTAKDTGYHAIETTGPTPRRLPRPWGWIAAVVALALIATVGWLRALESDIEPVRLAVPVDGLMRIRSRPGPVLDVSPDGRTVAFLAADSVGTRLFVRPLESLEVRPVPGSLNAFSPFFSADGEWLGYFAGGELRRVPVDGGQPLAITEVRGEVLGATDLGDGRVAFTQRYRGGISVAERGGGISALTELGEDGISDRHVTSLGGGDGILFTAWTERGMAIHHLDLETGIRTPITSGSSPRYAQGVLLFARVSPDQRSSTLFGAAFDPREPALLGDPTPLVEGIAGGGAASSSYTVSESGTLVYLPAPASELGDLVILDEAGSERVVSREPRVFHSPSFSPDGRQIAVGVDEAGITDIWVYDVSTRTARRLTTGGGALPVWTRDGSRIAYSAPAAPGVPATPARVAGITWQPSGGGPEALLLEGDALPRDWSSDGRELIYFDIDLETQGDLFRMPLDGGDTAPLLATSTTDQSAAVSPDGAWLAYTQGSTLDDLQVFLAPYDRPGAPTQLTGPGVLHPRWGASGRSLYYVRSTMLWSVPVQTTPSLTLGEPSLVHDFGFVPGSVFNRPFDVNGSAVVVIRRRQDRLQPIVVLDWLATQRDVFD